MTIKSIESVLKTPLYKSDIYVCFFPKMLEVRNQHSPGEDILKPMHFLIMYNALLTKLSELVAKIVIHTRKS